MSANRWKTVESVFNKSVTMPPDKRESFVVSVCAGDADLIEDVLTLLAEADKDNSFLSEPVFEVGAKILASEYIGLFEEPDFAAYEMQKILGRGGSGVVFLAKDVTLERNVAIKVLPSTLSDDDERIVRFRQEAKAASAISHPNVTHIYGFGKADGRYYLAMEYVQGKTLRELLKKREINRIKALEIACQITKALSAAHKAGIVHRDVKPENVIVTDDGLVKVLDFGLAKSFTAKNGETDGNLVNLFDTNPGLIFGTTAYMSPEQIRGKDFDWRTDIWSLGVVLYEMLAGTRPFVGETQSEIRKRILFNDPEFPPEIEEIPEIKKILVKTLAKAVHSRYEKTTDLANDLESVYKFLSNAVNDNKYSFAFSGTSSNGAHRTNEITNEIFNHFDNKLNIDDRINGKELENKKIKTVAKAENFSLTHKLLFAGIVLLIVIIVLVELFY